MANGVQISPKHLLPTKRERIKAVEKSQRGKKDVEAFMKADNVIDQIYVDLAKGVSKSECLKRMQEGHYNGVCVKKSMIKAYFDAAMQRFCTDTDIEAEKLKNLFYGRYEALLEEAVKRGDVYNARGILDSMSRIFGVEKKNPSTAIQINNGDDKLVVNFGIDGG